MKKNMRMMKSRLSVLFIFFIIIFGYLLVQVGLITFVKNENYDQRVLYQYVSKQTISDQITPKRGQIRDRNGIVMAENVRVYNVVYDPNGMIQQPEEMRTYSDQFIAMNLPEVTTSDLQRLVEEYPTSQYRVIAREMYLEDIINLKQAIDNNEIKGVYLEGYYKREYPYETMASDIIGMYDQAASARYGVEQMYDEELTGVYGRLYGYLDDDAFVKQEEIRPIDGYNVNLTMDFTIQKYVEEALENYMLENEAESANAIVMNPKTGEILAMATYPTFNLNEPYDLTYAYTEEEIENMSQENMSQAHLELWKNYNVSMTLEPGSTFKALMLAAALEEGVVELSDTFYCPGYKVVDKWTIGCWKHGGHGELTAYEGLVNSCNVVFMEIGELMGRDMMWHYMQLYGIGQQTGVDMIGEGGTNSSTFYTYDQLNVTERATSAFGQGFNMTPMQIIGAFSSLVNGGYIYEPYIMSSVVDDDSHIISTHEDVIAKNVLSQETSDILTESLIAVVEEGTGKGARIEGYDIGGKTGTAEKGDRDVKDYIVSFIGFVADEGEAELVTLVTIDDPISNNPNVDPSSALAVGVFKDIMEDVIPYWGIFPKEPVEEESEETNQ